MSFWISSDQGVTHRYCKERTLTSATHRDLAYDVCSPPNVDESKAHQPLLILHGFLFVHFQIRECSVVSPSLSPTAEGLNATGHRFARRSLVILKDPFTLWQAPPLGCPMSVGLNLSQDLRSHGSSPHCEPLTYTHMADDVLKFCAQQRLEGISLLGHSM